MQIANKNNASSRDEAQLKGQMKKFVINVATLFVTFLSLALVARGQAPAGAAVSPPVFPEFLPIGDEWQMKDWAVTNRQWRLNGNPLNVATSWSITYTEKDGSTSTMGTSSSGYKFLDWEDFMRTAQKIGLDLMRRVRATNSADPTKSMLFTVIHGYDNLSTRKGATGVFINTDLGTVDNVRPESFLDETGMTYLQAVIRVDGLESFEVSTNGGETWVKRPVQDYIALKATDLESGNFVRYRVKAKGQTQVYTQTGDKLSQPTIRVLSDKVIALYKTPGSITKIESKSSFDGEWTVLKEFAWTDLDQYKEVLIYPPDVGSGGVSLRLFRASSE